MNTIFKKSQEINKFWLNPDNWKIKFDENYIKLKRTLIETIIKSKNLNELSFNILNDIDLLACLLNVHTIKNSILKYRITHHPLLKNQDNKLHLIETGILDDDICIYVLHKLSGIKKNTKLAHKILTTKENYSYFYFFRTLLKNEQFTLELFECKNFSNAFSLISLPGHYLISKKLLERKSFPNQNTQDLKIQFNKMIFEDITFINKLLRQYRGQELFAFLPNHIQNNAKISVNMLKYHPEINTPNLKVKNIKNFKQASKFWFYINDFISQMNYHSHLFDDEKKILEAFECLTYFRKTSLYSDLSYTYHPFVKFLLTSNYSIVKDFLSTEKGKYLLSLPCNSSQNMTTIDNWIFEEFFNTIKKIELFKKLSLKSECKKEKQIKI